MPTHKTCEKIGHSWRNDDQGGRWCAVCRKMEDERDMEEAPQTQREMDHTTFQQEITALRSQLADKTRMDAEAGQHYEDTVTELRRQLAERDAEIAAMTKRVDEALSLIEQVRADVRDLKVLINKRNRG